MAALSVGADEPARRTDGTVPAIRGLTFTGPAQPPLDVSMFTSMTEVGGNYVAFVPEATVYRQTLDVAYDFEGQWFGETTEATLEGIRLARQADLKIMLKPHLDVRWNLSGWQAPEQAPHDEASYEAYNASIRAYIATQTDRTTGGSSWRGELDVANEEDWPRFAKGYRAFILDHARRAETLGIELFCIGTELKKIALNRPDYFRTLARDVRKVYRGELVYAANWDSYDRISFWDELDYIGIDAYFPISDAKTPTAEDVEAGWQPHVRRIDALYERFGKPVILTEWGYEDEDFPGKEPWIMGQPDGARPSPNPRAQANAYEGTLRATWRAPWMHGIFVWRWSPHPMAIPMRYSPRAKPAAEVLERWWRVAPSKGDPAPSTTPSNSTSKKQR